MTRFYTEAVILEAAATFAAEDFDRLPRSKQQPVLDVLMLESDYLLDHEVLTDAGWHDLQDLGMLMEVA